MYRYLCHHLTHHTPITKLRDSSRYVSPILACLLLAACQPAQDTTSTSTPPPPTKTDIIVAQTPATIPPAVVGLKKTDFPVYLDGVPSLLHPIIPSVPLDKKSENFAKSQDISDVSYFQQVSPYLFQSSIYNLVFEDIKTGATHRLFPQDNFVIKSVFYPFVDLKTITSTNTLTHQKTSATSSIASSSTKPMTQAMMSKVTQNQAVNQSNQLLLGHFIYQVKEKVNDEENKTNIDEQLSLYMSDNNGDHVIKLHPNDQFVKATKWLPELERFYFTTQADTNGDNVIDDNDKYFNYVIDFKLTPPEVKPYDFNIPKS